LGLKGHTEGPEEHSQTSSNTLRGWVFKKKGVLYIPDAWGEEEGGEEKGGESQICLPLVSKCLGKISMEGEKKSTTNEFGRAAFFFSSS